MKNIALIIAISFVSIFSVDAKTINHGEVTLEEINCDIINFAYEAELESANFMANNDVVLQELSFDIAFDEEEGLYNMREVKLDEINIDIPNLDYLEEVSKLDAIL